MGIIIWLIVAAILIVAEIVSMGLTTIWFAGGALLAALASYLGAHWLVQILIFAAVSVVLFVFTRPFALKHFMKDIEKTNVESLIGQEGVVKDAIDNVEAKGVVKLNGMDWTARSVDGIKIDAGQVVIVKEISGVKLMVVPKENN
ncbi:MAG: NfeD family protein [Wujia sp.]